MDTLEPPIQSRPTEHSWPSLLARGPAHGHRLGSRLLAYILLFSAGVSLFGTAVQLLTDYRRDVRALNERLEQIHSSYSGAISQSLWDLDEDVIRLQLEGITTLPGIVLAEVDSPVGIHSMAGNPEAPRKLTHSFPLSHDQMYLGTLEVSATLDDIYAQLRSRVLVILATQATKTFLISLFTLFIFQRLVTQHLATMAAYVRTLDVSRLGSPLVLHRKVPRSATYDELDEVASAINQMRESLQVEIIERRRSEAANALLAEAGAVLMESLDMEKILPRIAALCVRSLADWCLIDLVEGDEVRRVSGAHVDKAKRPLLDELQRHYPPGRDSKVLAATVLKLGRPLLTLDATEEEIHAACSDERHFQIMRELGIGNYLGVPLIARGQTLGAVTLGFASRERHPGPAEFKLAQELAHRAAIAIDNARLYHRAEQATRLREVFLSVAAHELRTPLLPLQLRLQGLLRKSAQAGSALEPHTLLSEVSAAEHQTKRIGQLVDQLLDVSTLSAGNPLELRRKPVDLCEVVEEVLDKMHRQIAFSGSPVVRTLHRPALGSWDPRRIEQVMTSLMHNALKFGEGQPIEVSVMPRERSVLLVVRDHGIGMSESDQARIFDRFTRGVSEHHFGGLGLGLYIARWIVEAHGGTINCQSQQGQGSTFTVELPMAEEPKAAG